MDFIKIPYNGSFFITSVILPVVLIIIYLMKRNTLPAWGKAIFFIVILVCILYAALWATAIWRLIDDLKNVGVVPQPSSLH